MKNYAIHIRLKLKRFTRDEVYYFTAFSERQVRWMTWIKLAPKKYIVVNIWEKL